MIREAMLCTAAVCCLSTGSATAEDATVVATVGGIPITADAVQREMIRGGSHDPSRFDELSEKRGALDAVVRAERLAQAAIDAGYDQRPEIRDEIKRLLGQRFWAEQYRARPPIHATDAEIQTYYEAHPEEFVEPIQVRGSIVFLRSRADASDAARSSLRQEAEALAGDVAAGRKTLASLAHERSDDRLSRQRGGDIGWVTPGQRMQRLEQIVLDALASSEAPGSASQVVETRRGVYLVQATDRRGGELEPLDQVRNRIARGIVAEKQRERADAELAELAGRYPLEVDEERLRTLVPLSLTAAGSGPPSFPLGNVGETVR